ncbi:hypothetical protein [Streptomyces chartreusis]|uniref:hypothetical protein n=1 Tax=Streptomyces chartreusis TaxID=1969 RepID=UPI00123D80A7|nr:hypothetical protein [Streptomyces chartreusis]QEV66231.1 hypothetical protein CP983_05840 [Streptomyces chartreusis]GGW98812.1 hypothetical protein GCM10010321_11560 [Streptomyces chartreusis]
MTVLPEPTPTAPAAGQAHRDATINERAEEMLAALNDAITREKQQTRYDNPDLPSHKDGTQIGTAAPVDQPGRAAMSKQATDDSVRMICFGGMILLTGAGIGIVMVASDYANPTVIGVFFGGLAALALAAARLLRRAGEAAPAEIHQHYSGNVYQQHSETHSRSVWAKNINEK